MAERAFRYQTGEVKEIAKMLFKKGSVDVDVIDQEKIKPFLKDMKRFGVFEDHSIPWDFEAISFFDNQEFLCRVFIKDRNALSKGGRKLFIDFYTDYEEESYDPIFLG